MVASRTDNAVIITDPEGKTEWVNAGFTRITGFTLDDIQGIKPGILLQGEETDPVVVKRISAAVSRGDRFPKHSSTIPRPRNHTGSPSTHSRSLTKRAS